MHTKSRPPAALFRPDEAASSGSVTLQFEGRTLTAPAGVSVAAALLLNGVGPFRSTPVKGTPRAPYCMMGVCFDCLCDIDGKPSRQSCLVPVRQGMVVKAQAGASALVSEDEGESRER